MERLNKTLSRLVFTSLGRPISDATLAPLDIARAMLAAVVGHASLFFQGGILHRDILPTNIVARTLSIPIPTEERRREEEAKEGAGMGEGIKTREDVVGRSEGFIQGSD